MWVAAVQRHRHQLGQFRLTRPIPSLPSSPPWSWESKKQLWGQEWKGRKHRRCNQGANCAPLAYSLRSMWQVFKWLRNRHLDWDKTKLSNVWKSDCLYFLNVTIKLWHLPKLVSWDGGGRLGRGAQGQSKNKECNKGASCWMLPMICAHGNIYGSRIEELLSLELLRKEN